MDIFKNNLVQTAIWARKMGYPQAEINAFVQAAQIERCEKDLISTHRLLLETLQLAFPPTLEDAQKLEQSDLQQNVVEKLVGYFDDLLMSSKTSLTVGALHLYEQFLSNLHQGTQHSQVDSCPQNDRITNLALSILQLDQAKQNSKH